MIIILQALGLEGEIVVVQGYAAAQQVVVGGDSRADRRGHPGKAIARKAVQDHLSVALLAGAGDDGNRVPCCGELSAAP